MRASASKFAGPVAVGVLAVACSQHANDDLRVSLSPSLVVPRGLLDNVADLKVTVYDAVNGIDCDATTGKSKGTNGSTPIATTPLGKTNCPAPAKFCGDLSISSSSTPRVFAAVATDNNGVDLADGCAKLVVNQEKLPLTIVMQRNVPPSTCGDSVVQPTEQCDPPGNTGDLVCDNQCQTQEERLSVGAGNGTTIDGAPGDHQRPSFAWPSQSGGAGRFLAVWSDKKTRQQAAMRIMSDSLDVDSSLGPAPSTVSSWVPDAQSNFPSNGEPSNQAFPAATFLSNKYFVAFQDDATGHLEIHLRTMSITNPTVGDQPNGSPVGISGPNGAGEPGVIHTLPALAAGPGGAVYVAWQAGSTIGPGKIVGRMYTAGSGTPYGPQVELSSGATNQSAQVAATSSGWVVVWQSGSDIGLRRIGMDGNPSAAEQKVNDGSHHGTQDHPGVATAGDAFAVVWADHGAAGGTDIFVQRYKSDGSAIPGDQANRINNVVGDGEQTTPAIAGSTAAGGMYAVAWIDAGSTHVRARLLDTVGGFLFNNLDGQSNEFQASVVDGNARDNPALAIGGAGPFIAIGWENLDPSRPGIFVRRFPLPSL